MYKRQDYAKRIAELDEDLRDAAEILVTDCSCYTPFRAFLMDAVSYTHLDVYKRQEPDSSSTAAAPDISHSFGKWSGVACDNIVHSFLDLAVKFKAAGQFLSLIHILSDTCYGLCRACNPASSS